MKINYLINEVSIGNDEKLEQNFNFALGLVFNFNYLKKINELANTEKSKSEVEKDSQGNVIRVVTRSVVINNIPHGEPQPPQRLICLNCQFACFIKTKADIENFCKYRFRNVYSMENTQDEDIIEDCDGTYIPEDKKE